MNDRKKPTDRINDEKLKLAQQNQLLQGTTHKQDRSAQPGMGSIQQTSRPVQANQESKTNRKATTSLGPLESHAGSNSDQTEAEATNRLTLQTHGSSLLSQGATNRKSTMGQLRQKSQAASSSSGGGSSERTAPRAIKLMVEPFQFMSYLKWESQLAFNNHGTLVIKGLVAQENRDSYLDMVMGEVWVCAKAIGENDEEIILFQGILTALTIDSVHQYHTMSIQVKTGSYLLDQTLHTRTFQPDEMTYQHVIETCLASSGGEFIMREKQGATTGQLTVQYQESDFSFISRLAQRLGVVILPEYKTQGKRILLGLVQGVRGSELISNDCTTSNTTADPDSLIRYEHGVYHVRTREIYELGETVIFQGRRLFIGEIKSNLEGSELMHHYTLCLLKPAYERLQPYEKIKGISMRGSVTAVERDRVQVQLHEDENKDNSGKRWFEYATVYSSPDSTGWFVQPEVNDEIRLIFSNVDESSAYVASSVHLETNGGRTNPDHKSWKNKQNKEILFTPECLTITNNQGLSIELDDAKGITISSNRGIFIDAKGPLHLNSDQAGVTVYGDRNVTVKQGAAQIRMKDAVDVGGGKINMN